MTQRTALGEAILNHWRTHCPAMVRDLQKSKRLSETLFQAQEQTGDLIYELVCVSKMDYQAAWEIAMQEWATRANAGRPETSPPAKRRTSRSSSRSRTSP